MPPPKYMSEEGLFEALGDFSMNCSKLWATKIATGEGEMVIPPSGGLTTQLWEDLPLRRGLVPSAN